MEETFSDDSRNISGDEDGSDSGSNHGNHDGSDDTDSSKKNDNDSNFDEESDELDSDEHDTESDGKGEGYDDDVKSSTKGVKREEKSDEEEQDSDETPKDVGSDESHEDSEIADESDDKRKHKRKRKMQDTEIESETIAGDNPILRFQSISKTGGQSKKPSKPGIIYLSRIPPFMKPKKLNFIFGQYGEVGRIFLQQEDKNFRKSRKKKSGNKARSYTEGWIEFKKKKIAKRVAITFNNTRIGDKKRSRYYDDLWNIKYLPRFQWAHLMERLEYEKQVRQQRIRTEVMQAKKETNFYLKNVEQQKVIERMKTKKRKQGKEWDFHGRNFKQWKTEEEREDDRRMLQEEMPQRSGKVTASVLGKIFKK